MCAHGGCGGTLLAHVCYCSLLRAISLEALAWRAARERCHSAVGAARSTLPSLCRRQCTAASLPDVSSSIAMSPTCRAVENALYEVSLTRTLMILRLQVVLTWTLGDGRRTSLLDWVAMYLLGEVCLLLTFSSQKQRNNRLIHSIIWTRRRMMHKQ